MEEEQQKPLNKYVTYIKNNKYNLYFIVAIVILISLIIAIITITVNTSPKSTASLQKPTPQAAVSSVPSVSSYPSVSSNTAVITPDPTQTAVIENQTQQQLSPTITIPYTVSKINQYGADWAIMEITNPNTDPANVVVKKEGGIWKVMLGPGTHIDLQQLQQIGAPADLINDANSNL